MLNNILSKIALSIKKTESTIYLFWVEDSGKCKDAWDKDFSSIWPTRKNKIENRHLKFYSHCWCKIFNRLIKEFTLFLLLPQYSSLISSTVKWRIFSSIAENGRLVVGEIIIEDGIRKQRFDFGTTADLLFLRPNESFASFLLLITE